MITETQPIKPIKAKPGLYAFFYEELKRIARDMGYNLVLHGSLNRDLDLIAIPWVNEPKPELDMVIAFDEYLRGVSYEKSCALVGYMHSVLPGGRKSYVINLNRGGPWNHYTDEQYYIDLSITPIVKP